MSKIVIDLPNGIPKSCWDCKIVGMCEVFAKSIETKEFLTKDLKKIRHPQCILTEPTPLNSDVEEDIKYLERNLLRNDNGSPHMKSMRHHMNNIRQALEPKKITNEEVETLFTFIEIDLQSKATNTYQPIEYLDKLKQAYINQQEEIEDYTKWYHKQCNKVIDKVREINNLEDKLDKIEEVINSDKPMSYRLAIARQILKEETKNE